jgi:hypothetical protein
MIPKNLLLPVYGAYVVELYAAVEEDEEDETSSITYLPKNGQQIYAIKPRTTRNIMIFN